MSNNNNSNDKGKGEQDKGKGKGKVLPTITDGKRDEGIALAATVIATSAKGYANDLDATSAFGTWVKATTAGKRGSKVTLADLVRIFDGAPGTSKSAMSKAMTVAATTAAQRRDYLTSAGERPSVDGLYLSVRVVTPRAKGDEQGETTETTEQGEQGEPATIADSDCAKIAADILAGLATRGATRLQVSLIIAELDRLTTPVKSVPAAA